MKCFNLRASDNLEKELKSLDWTPQIAILSYEESFEFSQTKKNIKKIFPNIQFFGASSCQGFMDSRGLSNHKAECSILLMGEDDMEVGVAQVKKTSDKVKDGEIAIQMACEQANCPGQTPVLALIFSAPGDEEDILKGIVNIIGDDVPIIGGSSGDNTISGNWSQIANEDEGVDSVNIAVFYTSSRVSTYFHSGFTSKGISGIVTKAQGREVLEIDNKPAAFVYNEWSGNQFSLDIETRPQNILAKSSLFPLGRKANEKMSTSFYKLSHVENITKDKGLTTFTTILEGESLFVMEGSFETIIDRALRVLNQAKEIAELKHEDISGVILTFCAGCRLTLGEDMQKVYDLINSEFLKNKIPLITFYTFGEQGHISNETNIHGNLMISAVLLTK